MLALIAIAFDLIKVGDNWVIFPTNNKIQVLVNKVAKANLVSTVKNRKGFTFGE